MDHTKIPQVKELLGVPADEPIFVIRAQDAAAIGALQGYSDEAKRIGATNTFLKGVQDDIYIPFVDFLRKNADRVKVPD